MRSFSPSSIFVASLFAVILTGCGKSSGSSPTTSANEKAKINNPAGTPDRSIPEKVAKAMEKAPTAPTNPVKSFAFVPPSNEWSQANASEGDGTYTKSSYKMSGSNAQLTISSVGLPAKGAKATKLVADCETGFARGIAQHPDMAREWITKGFSISRYADPATGEVSVWCITNTCKVKLDFGYGKDSKAVENVKAADAATNAFFEKNPNGGAVLK